MKHIVESLRLKSQVPILALTAFIVLAPQSALAQIKVLKTFPQSALEGANPKGGGVVIGNQYFGTTQVGGTNGKGVLYRVNLDGTGFTKLKEFSSNEGQPNYDNWANPNGLLTAGGQIYGTLGGASNNWEGSIYRVDATGSNFAELYNFRGNTSAGYRPNIAFVDGNTLYGFCYYGGDAWEGTLFKINTDGSGFQKLYDFQSGADGQNPIDIVDGGSVIYGITIY